MSEEPTIEKCASEICQTLRIRWGVAVTSSEDREVVAEIIRKLLRD